MPILARGPADDLRVPELKHIVLTPAGASNSTPWDPKITRRSTGPAWCCSRLRRRPICLCSSGCWRSKRCRPRPGLPHSRSSTPNSGSSSGRTGATSPEARTGGSCVSRPRRQLAGSLLRCSSPRLRDGTSGGGSGRGSQGRPPCSWPWPPRARPGRGDGREWAVHAACLRVHRCRRRDDAPGSRSGPHRARRCARETRDRGEEDGCAAAGGHRRRPRGTGAERAACCAGPAGLPVQTQPAETPEAAGTQSAAPAAGIPDAPDAPRKEPDVLAAAEVFSAEDPLVAPPHLVRPQLPTISRSGARVEDLPELEILVSATGGVENVRLISRGTEPNSAMMLSAVKAWFFQPATRDGQPVRYRLRMRLPGR